MRSPPSLRATLLALVTTGVTALVVLAVSPLGSRPIATRSGVLPAGTELNDDLFDRPTERFAFEAAGGKRSYLFNLGDMAFSSPAIFGGLARQAGISCDTCHQGGAGNSKLYIPGLSLRPGTFDTTNALFNPKTDNGVFDAVTPPSLRGARYLAPYGHDGRSASLRDFIHNVIVNEFAGPEPSPEILDALVTYVQEISFLPNPNLAAGGRLTEAASAAARRGEVLFHKPFPRDASLSCAACHKPSAAFVDRLLHDVGSGGLFKTPTLVNANYNAPYFHDGRYDTYEQVIGHFDQAFALGLTDDERKDLVAYLEAVGHGEQPFTRETVDAVLDEIDNFASVLDTALDNRDLPVIELVVDTVGNEWRELGEQFPDRANTSIIGGLSERLAARRATLAAGLSLRRIAMTAAAGDYQAARRAYADYRKDAAAAQLVVKQAETWSLFDPATRERHFSALRQLDELAATAPPWDSPSSHR
ncbi:MAG: cytochrome c peroxidase [Rhodoplanes sp.]